MPTPPATGRLSRQVWVRTARPTGSAGPRSIPWPAWWPRVTRLKLLRDAEGGEKIAVRHLMDRQIERLVADLRGKAPTGLSSMETEPWPPLARPCSSP